MKMFFFLILNIPLLAYGQISLKGIVLDSIHNEPVPFATVYINGTTKGTLTDSNGVFIINEVSIPTEVIVSHISYSPKSLYINDVNTKRLVLKLNLKNVKLPEALVADGDLRKKNIKEFKRLFLGSDYLGKKAILKNDSSLFFIRNYSPKKILVNDSIRNEIKWGAIKEEDIIRWDRDSSNIIVKELNFSVSANAPLIIDMPLLGYKLQVDLVDFNAQYIDEDIRCVFLGYYYFQPYKTESKLKVKKYGKKRVSVYYNSSQHFCRSLYSNELEENGYQVAETISNDSINKFKDVLINIDDYLKPAKDGKRQIVGLNNKFLTVRYHCKRNGIPVDLTEKKGEVIMQSRIYFLNDTCTIRGDGTIPDSTIIFGGSIGEKRVGSILPSDYSVNNLKFVTIKN